MEPRLRFMSSFTPLETTLAGTSRARYDIPVSFSLPTSVLTRRIDTAEGKCLPAKKSNREAPHRETPPLPPSLCYFIRFNEKLHSRSCGEARRVCPPQALSSRALLTESDFRIRLGNLRRINALRANPARKLKLKFSYCFSTAKI